MTDTNTFILSAYLKKFGINTKGKFPSGWALISPDPVQVPPIDWVPKNVFISLSGIPADEKEQKQITEKLNKLVNTRIIFTDISIIPGKRWNKDTNQEEPTIELKCSWKKIFPSAVDIPYNKGCIDAKVIQYSIGDVSKVLLEQRYLNPSKNEWKSRQLPAILLNSNTEVNLNTQRKYTFLESKIGFYEDKFVVLIDPKFTLPHARS